MRFVDPLTDERRIFDAAGSGDEDGEVRRLSPTILFTLSLVSWASPAFAERPLSDLDAVRAACRESEGEGRRELYSVEVPRFRFGAPEEDEPGRLFVDTARNLRALNGALELFSAGLEPIGFAARGARSTQLQEGAARLRLGFFLGFDGTGQACVLRSAAGVTTVRMDLAFAELLDARGRVIAREDTERLRAWSDDLEEVRPVEIGAPIPRGGAVDVRGLESALPAIAACHVAGVAQGASADAQVSVRLTVRSGQIAEATTELSSLGSRRATRCVIDALRVIRVAGDGVVTVPIRLRRP